MQPLNIYDFDIEIEAAGISDELADQVFEAISGDGVLCQNDRIVCVNFQRSARSWDAAVDGAIRQLVKGGVTVVSRRPSAQLVAT